MSAEELSGATMFYAINLPLPCHVLFEQERGNYRFPGIQSIFKGHDARLVHLCNSDLGSK